MSNDQQPAPTAWLGKYRGLVVDNQDPYGRGRIRVNVPQMMADSTVWALPCLPYAGPGVGFYMIPPIGATVWVEFEGGNLDLPIWVGCFWAEQEVPDVATGPDRKVIKTETGTVIIDDSAGNQGVIITTESAGTQVVTSIVMNHDGIKITTDQAAIALEPNQGITINLAEGEITLDLADLRRRRPRSGSESIE